MANASPTPALPSSTMQRSALSGFRSGWAGAAVFALLLSVACQSPPAEPAEEPPEEPVLEDETEDAAELDPTLEEEAIEAIREGDLEEARELLAERLVEEHLADARRLLAEGVPADALVSLDHVLELAPRHPEGRLQKAHASLALAEKGIAEGGGALLVEGSLVDAIEYYRRSGDTPEALLGASRAAWLLGRPAEALGYAKRADAALAEETDEPEDLRLVPERVLSEAAFSTYVEARANEAAAEETAPLFDTTRDALERLIGRASTDSWAWSTLSDLFVWEERLDEARRTLETGLDRLPEDGTLLSRLADVARRQGGSQAVVDVFAALNERHPDVALGIWYEAIETFNLAVELIMASFGEDWVASEDPEALPNLLFAAEDRFRQCRELEETYTDSCRGYEVMCRAGLGWARFAQERYPEAVAAFLSMESLIEGGLTWQLEGRLLSGVMGLHLTGKAFGDAGDNLNAGETYALLHEYQPEDLNWVNNVGFFMRDAAVELEVIGKRLGAAARGTLTNEQTLAALREFAKLDPGLAGTDEEKTELALAANATMARARELMERSVEAYAIAAALAPEDVRIVNDHALILLYYLHRDLDYAEEILLRCVEMGAKQLENEELTDDQRFEIANAWGDAHENLGVLHAIFRNDPAAAIPWFEKAAEIGPAPRPNVTNIWLPNLRDDSDPEADRDLLQLKGWARAFEDESR